MLPTKSTIDYYGSRVPSRFDIKKGTKGSFHNSQTFWQKVEDGVILI